MNKLECLCISLEIVFVDAHKFCYPYRLLLHSQCTLVRNLVDDIDVLGKYPEDSNYIIGKDLSNKSRLKEDILR
jgi:hypothetical protein